MPVPNYDASADYEVGMLVTHNDVVYAKGETGSDTAPGTDGSFWAVNDRSGVEAAATQAAVDLEQALVDAGFKPQYVYHTLKYYYN